MNITHRILDKSETCTVVCLSNKRICLTEVEISAPTLESLQTKLDNHFNEASSHNPKNIITLVRLQETLYKLESGDHVFAMVVGIGGLQEDVFQDEKYIDGPYVVSKSIN